MHYEKKRDENSFFGLINKDNILRDNEQEDEEEVDFWEVIMKLFFSRDKDSNEN